MRGGYEDTELGLYTLLTKYRQTHKNLPSNVYTIITKDQLKLDYYLYSYDVVIMVCRTIVYKNWILLQHPKNFQYCLFFSQTLIGGLLKDWVDIWSICDGIF